MLSIYIAIYYFNLFYILSAFLIPVTEKPHWELSVQYSDHAPIDQLPCSFLISSLSWKKQWCMECLTNICNINWFYCFPICHPFNALVKLRQHVLPRRRDWIVSICTASDTFSAYHSTTRYPTWMCSSVQDCPPSSHYCASAISTGWAMFA